MHCASDGDVEHTSVDFGAVVRGVGVWDDNLVELQTFGHVRGSDDHTVGESVAAVGEQKNVGIGGIAVRIVATRVVAARIVAIRAVVRASQLFVEFGSLCFCFANDAEGSVVGSAKVGYESGDACYLPVVAPESQNLRLLTVAGNGFQIAARPDALCEVGDLAGRAVTFAQFHNFAARENPRDHLGGRGTVWVDRLPRIAEERFAAGEKPLDHSILYRRVVLHFVDEQMFDTGSRLYAVENNAQVRQRCEVGVSELLLTD